jgi:signal transduction histidine kinase
MRRLCGDALSDEIRAGLRRSWGCESARNILTQCTSLHAGGRHHRGLLREVENGQLAELRVCDRGPGVPEDEREAILRPFYQVDTVHQKETGGYGLGLAIASRVVRLHGGSIVAANRSGGGLAVRMLFPVV